MAVISEMQELFQMTFYLPFLAFKKVMPVRHEHTPFNDTLFINELAAREIIGCILNHGT